ncbi:MAG: radical SAM protein [Methylococcaceae bacterium]
MKKKNVAGSCGELKSLQIHPSRLCNLSCLHCYSSSSPKERGALDVALLSNALSDAADEGFNHVSISGGEPLLYKSLEELLRNAKEAEYTTAVTTNGMLLDKQRLEMLQEITDLIAVSLDGIPESHNRMRNSEIAFEKMFSNLKLLRRSKIPFGFIFTLTQYNLHELDWVIDFAIEQGASLLQIHPLENTGFAGIQLLDEFPDRKESAYAYLYSGTMTQKLNGKIAIQIDYANRTLVQEEPNQVYVLDPKPTYESPMSDCLGRLTIEPDGAIVPIQYGFSRKYALGDLHKAGFKQLANDWKQNKMNDFYDLCESVYQEVIDDSKPFVFNWNEIITAASNRETQVEFPVKLSASQ